MTNRAICHHRPPYNLRGKPPVGVCLLEGNQMVKQLVVLMGMVGLVGCASFLPHHSFSDEETRSDASSFAYLVTCANRGLAPKDVVHRFGYAYNQLLSVSVYNKSLYEQTYQEYMSGYAKDFSTQMAAMCAGIPRDLPRITEMTLQKHASIMASRNAAIQSMGASLASYNPGTQTYYQPQMMLNNNQPTFGLPASNSNNYLINSSGGQRLCNVSTSGYVRCN